MRRLLFVILFFTVSCTETSEMYETEVINTHQASHDLSNFDEYFLKLDTLQESFAIGCSAGFYKILTEKYILRVQPDLAFNYEDIRKYDDGNTSAGIALELIEFENGGADFLRHLY